jgi:endoglucanase
MITRRGFVIGSLAALALPNRGMMQAKATTKTDVAIVSININGGDIFNQDLPETLFKHHHGYIYPSDYVKVLQQFYDLGLRVVQLPFKIERVWRDYPSGKLHLKEVELIKEFVASARSVGLQVHLSPHNFASFYEAKLGSDGWPVEAFAKFWGMFAKEFKDENGVWGFSLDTEPVFEAPFADGIRFWQPAAQGAVDAIRKVDKNHLITVPGSDHWGNSQLWRYHSDALRIEDPSDNFAFEATCYGDYNFSGKYDLSYAEQSQVTDPPGNHAHPDIMVERVTPFVEWLSENNYRGMVSEWGVPTDDPDWLVVADHFLQFLQENGVGSSAWAWGPWWPADYPLYISPAGEMARLLGNHASS